MSRFDLNLLGALDALLAEQNVTRAAERLHVTQPTMSGMLQRLRYQFGDPILVRIGRNMELTPVGKSLVDPAREALRGIDRLVKSGPVFDPATSGRTFTVMASDYCTMTLLPRVVQALAQAAPAVRLEIRALDAPVERLASGEVDLCISTDDRCLLHCEDVDAIQSEPLFSDQFVCVMAADHPLHEGFTLADYLRYPHVGVQMAGDLGTIEATTLRRHIPTYRPSFTAANFSMIPYMVAGSDLVGIVQRRLAVIARASLPIKMLAPPFAIPDINEALLWHARHSDDLAHLWLRKILSREAAAWSSTEPAVARPRPGPRMEPPRRVPPRLYVAATA